MVRMRRPSKLSERVVRFLDEPQRKLSDFATGFTYTENAKGEATLCVEFMVTADDLEEEG